MSDKEEFVSLEKALKELKLKEEELKRLVSEGEIRAFRDADKMKFKRDDVEKLKQDTGKTIQFQDESSDTLTDDLIFDEEVEDLELDDAEIGMATAPISSDETFVDDTPKKKSKKHATAKTRATRVQSSATKTTSVPAASRGKTSTVRRTTGRSTRIRVEAETAKTQIHPAMLGVLILTSIILLYGCAVWWDTASGDMSGVTKGLAEKAAEMFIKK
ncbi:MAG TPA: hypothetical protein ENK43_08180 [Planctomycetes bacterium]|nr:hypothetical protein [Planctomycetota bacterium]